ncbi:glycosyl transferase family 2 [Crinalium epipsammum PCC 9333]|uniref:Glycosyl transferase family 2 n=1 Tax=Crinalium epipsammum PCC 9333 TaxID=1173022 RepID=K9W1E7_9CYAN|nr:glycosyltransferase family A protein [Crinalium epipsammum]AFZ13619.1 glycosyl transferase family 2 [Crinalium epipsammum PCC 9333]
MKPIKISVIVPTYHRNDLLAKCLDNLSPKIQTFPSEEYEVIVTDDGAKTTAKQMICDHYPWVKWVAGPRKGPAANRNNGAEYAQGEWLVFTDDDCVPQPNWLNAFAKETKGEALALEGAIHPLGDPKQDMAECPINLTGGWFWSANIAIERALFEKIGGFDANYPLALHEDVDIRERLYVFTTILFVPEASVFHPVRLIPLKSAISRIPKRCAATAYHLAKHRKDSSNQSVLGLTIFEFKYHLRHLLGGLRKGKIKFAYVSFLTIIIGTPVFFFYILMYSKSKQKFGKSD